MFVTEWNYNVDDIKTGVYVSSDFKNWNRVSFVKFDEIWRDFHILNKALHIASVYVDGKPYAYKVNNQYVGLFGESTALVKVYTKNLKEWNYKFSDIVKGIAKWNSTLVETGALIRVKDGYVLILNGRDKKRRYSIGYAILDEKLELEDVSEEPIICPTKGWEKSGIAANVTFFSNGISIRKGKTKIIYGAADQRIGKIEIDYGVNNTLEITKKEFVEKVLEKIRGCK